MTGNEKMLINDSNVERIRAKLAVLRARGPLKPDDENEVLILEHGIRYAMPRHEAEVLGIIRSLAAPRYWVLSSDICSTITKVAKARAWTIPEVYPIESEWMRPKRR